MAERHRRQRVVRAPTPRRPARPGGRDTRRQPAPTRPRDFRLAAADARPAPAARRGEPRAAGRPSDRGHDRSAHRLRPRRPRHDARRRRWPTVRSAELGASRCRGAGRTLRLCAPPPRGPRRSATATQAMPTPPRPRDYQLTDGRRSPPAPGRLASLGRRLRVATRLVSRPLAIGLTTLGLAGLLVAGAPSLMQGGATSSGPTRDATITSPGASRRPSPLPSWPAEHHQCPRRTPDLVSARRPGWRSVRSDRPRPLPTAASLRRRSRYRWDAERRPDPIRRHARRRRQAGGRGRLGERGGP